MISCSCMLRSYFIIIFRLFALCIIYVMENYEYMWYAVLIGLCWQIFKTTLFIYLNQNSHSCLRFIVCVCCGCVWERERESLHITGIRTLNYIWILKKSSKIHLKYWLSKYKCCIFLYFFFFFLSYLISKILW